MTLYQIEYALYGYTVKGQQAIIREENRRFVELSDAMKEVIDLTGAYEVDNEPMFYDQVEAEAAKYEEKNKNQPVKVYYIEPEKLKAS